MITCPRKVSVLGDNPFSITGRGVARYALGEILFDDPGATRHWMARSATPLLIRSERDFAFHLVSAGQPMVSLLPWDEPLARDLVFVGPEPDTAVTERQAWERVRRTVAHARKHAVWFTAEKALDHINRLTTADGTRLTRHYVRDPRVLRLQLRVALQDATGREISEKDIAKLLARGDAAVRAWAIRRLPRLAGPAPSPV